VAAELSRQGWSLLARNWRGEHGELDIIASLRGRLRFVEVKLREPEDPVGLECISASKRRHLARAAEEWLMDYEDLYDEACFLVVLVEGGQMSWLDHAFDAGPR
jgi:putative endonuclease